MIVETLLLVLLPYGYGAIAGHTMSDADHGKYGTTSWLTLPWDYFSERRGGQKQQCGENVNKHLAHFHALIKAQ